MVAQVAKPSSNGSVWNRNEKQADVRKQNILAAKAVADLVRTSLGPKGMDKMIKDGRGGVIITNDGATILKELSLVHPTAKMMVELSKAQDIEAGDGTTSVVVICKALLEMVEDLLNQGIHPQSIADSLKLAVNKTEEILESIAKPISLEDKALLTNIASISLQSKVVSQNSSLLAPIAVNSVLNVMDTPESRNVDLKNIKIVKSVGGTIDDTEMVDGLVFTEQKAIKSANGPSRITNAKIGLIQFCLSTPKTDMDNSIVVKDYQSIDRIMREERIITAKMVKQIAQTGCNVLLIQKSILRDAVTELSLDYLSKAKIMVIKDIEREDIEFIRKSIGCEEVASLDHFTADKLGTASLVESEFEGGSRIVKITGVNMKNTASILIKASNTLMLDEAERSLHDALCVVRCLVKKRAVLPGGGAPEMVVSYKLSEWAKTLEGVSQVCVKAFAEALEIIPYTLAENAGLYPLSIITELRAKHVQGLSSYGINIRKNCISDMMEDNIIQPLLVTLSAIKLATETVLMILKIDDIVSYSNY
ncbi:chaperonin-60kD, ch60, putative [Theileria equi strain WA]|uniref:T-complex protein 1 subunit delta n=1 Tax=Theileria equi strain WA TaxID=1537102 RepID=L0AXS3_THEEQ|nr:chaperonin-60kD, ch60, putative [Theileria equi strain WA]AFZ80360.1 chaperonin-60kD, ch60, putative [Theileria equi strain WA]|eukprot:XP_004830026.1 chaperonin-60kD, ch60, putative [Theileria equi strain WA]